MRKLDECRQDRLAKNSKERKVRKVNAYRAENQKKIEAWAKDNPMAPEVEQINPISGFCPAIGKDAEEDRPEANRFSGVPWHEPDETMAHYFDGVRLNGNGRALLVVQKVGAETFEWHERPDSRALGVYLWRKCGGSVVVMTKMTDLSPARCRDLVMNAEKIAALTGGTVETATGDKMYVDSEQLGLKMIATAAKAHERISSLIPSMEPREAIAAAKELIGMGLLLQGLPTVRTASVNEKVEDEGRINRRATTFEKLAEKVEASEANRLRVVEGGK